jgi:excisionase family DNA binding protein
MEHPPQRLKQALEHLRQALEETESALLDFEGSSVEEEQVRSEERRGEDLLSVSEVCQGIGMSKSWVHHRLKSGEIPNIRLGNNIKVRRRDLQEYLESQRHQPPDEEEEEE